MMDSYETFDVTFFDRKVNEFELPVNKAIKSFSFGMKAKLKMYYNLPIDINQMQQLIDIKKEEYQILLKTKH